MASQVMVQRVAREEIARKIRDQQRGLVLYNPDTEWREIKALGGIVLFPPDLGGRLIPHLRKVDPKTGQPVTISANGRVEVHDRYGYKVDKRGRRSLIALKGETALEIVQHIMTKHPEIAYLTGDKAEDAKSVKLARQNMLSSRMTEARRIWKTRTDFLARWKQDQPGQDPPPPTERQRQSKQYIDENETVQGWKAFLCRTCYQFDSDDFEPYQQHMKLRHNIEVTDPRVGGKKVELDLVGREVDAEAGA